jgi:hypothetical protein
VTVPVPAGYVLDCPSHVAAANWRGHLTEGENGTVFAISVDNCSCAAQYEEISGSSIRCDTFTSTGNDMDDDVDCCARCNAEPTCEFWVRSTSSCCLRHTFSSYSASTTWRGAWKKGVEPQDSASTLASSAAFDLDASAQVGTTVKDGKAGIEFGTLEANPVVSADGVDYWDLASTYLERSGGGTRTETDTYTYAFLLQWAKDDDEVDSRTKSVLAHSYGGLCSTLTDGEFSLGGNSLLAYKVRVRTNAGSFLHLQEIRVYNDNGVNIALPSNGGVASLSSEITGFQWTADASHLNDNVSTTTDRSANWFLGHCDGNPCSCYDGTSGTSTCYDAPDYCFITTGAGPASAV